MWPRHRPLLCCRSHPAPHSAAEPGLEGRVAKRGEADGKLVVVGEFGTVAGGSFGKIARLNPDGSADTEFSPGMGANGIVHSVGIQQDGGIIISGEFTTVDGKEYPYVARLQPNGILDEEWGGAAVGMPSPLRAVAMNGLSDGNPGVRSQQDEV
mgnify:CR=1 FL=1